MKQIVLDHPKGQVFITITSNEEKLVTHVAKKIEDTFGIKKQPGQTMEDLFGGMFGNLGKK